jgi:hypothetical protein
MSRAAKVAAVLLLVLCPIRTSAQAFGGGQSVKGFVTVSAGVAQPSSRTFTQVATMSDGDWPAVTTPPLVSHSAGIEYEIKKNPTIDVGGGILFGPGLGIGVAVTRYADKHAARVGTTLVAQGVTTLTAQATSDPLERIEVGVHVQVLYAVPMSGRFQFTMFGGPSRFSIKQDVMADLDSVVSPARTLTLTISGLESERANASGWGAHVGTDATYFLSDSVGIGALVRYSRAKVSLPNPMLSKVRQRTVTGDVDAGGIQVSGGLRLRF